MLSGSAVRQSVLTDVNVTLLLGSAPEMLSLRVSCARRRPRNIQMAVPKSSRAKPLLASSARDEVLLRGATGDQPREVIQLLGVLVDEAEGQLQPLAVWLLLERSHSVQIPV